MSPQLEFVALLSAANVASDGQPDGGNIGALQNVGGTSLIGWQMAILQKCDVTTFLIEVDSVPGELLNLADTYRQSGVRVEFVRSAKDLQSFLKPPARLVILAEAHYFSASTITEFTQLSAPFVATIDSRDENGTFERIDLNTRWAGLAIIDAATARSLMELPEGWSITSSLLRHAIQCGVKFLPVVQGKLQSGDIARISSQTSADVLVDRILDERTNRAPGFVERYIFGPIGKRIAPYVWASRSSGKGAEISAVALAFGSLGCGVMGWSVTAAVTAVLAIFVRLISTIIDGLSDSARNRMKTRLFWAALISAAIAAAWTESDLGGDAAAFMAIAVGLIAISYKTTLPRWASGLLQSPAMLASVMLIAATLSSFSLGTKLTAMAQLGLLVAGVYLPEAKPKNSNQA